MRLFYETYARMNVQVVCFQCNENINGVATRQKYGNEFEIFVSPHKCEAEMKEEEDE